MKKKFLRQHGAALLLCLLMLTTLSLLGLAAASDNALQIRVSGNLEASSDSQNAGSHALKWGENWLFGLDGLQRPTACASDCPLTRIIRSNQLLADGVLFKDREWWRNNAQQTGIDPISGAILNQGLAEESSNSFWLIEELHSEGMGSPDSTVKEVTWYRLLSKNFYENGSASSAAESIIARPWGDSSLSNPWPATLEQAGICFSDAKNYPCGRVAWKRHQ